jgi:hypothetical protein
LQQTFDSTTAYYAPPADDASVAVHTGLPPPRYSRARQPTLHRPPAAPINAIAPPGHDVKPSRHPSVPNDNHQCTAGRLLCTAGHRRPPPAKHRHCCALRRRLRPPVHKSTTGAQGGTKAASLQLLFSIYKYAKSKVCFQKCTCCHLFSF